MTSKDLLTIGLPISTVSLMQKIKKPEETAADFILRLAIFYGTRSIKPAASAPRNGKSILARFDIDDPDYREAFFHNGAWICAEKRVYEFATAEYPDHMLLSWQEIPSVEDES